MSSKNVTTERASFTKAEREYVKGIIRNLSLQRFSDREIVQWLYDEKNIDISRSAVSKIRNQLEKDSVKWFVELRQSAPKIVTIYKGCLDSLLSYQKQLHEMINNNATPEIKLRAISELHRIELSFHDFFKELPNFSIEDMQPKEENDPSKIKTFDEWFESDYMKNHVPRIGNETDWENGQYYRNLQKKYNDYVKQWKESESINEACTIDDSDKKGLERPLCDGDTWVQCYGCHYWFREGIGFIRSHDCSCIFAEFPMSIEGELIKFKFELIEPEAWANKPEPKPLVAKPKDEIVIRTQEAAPIVETPTEEPIELEPVQNDTIDLDIAGRYPMPIDYHFSWVQCKFTDCQKWFKTKELISKHVVKYHT